MYNSEFFPGSELPKPLPREEAQKVVPSPSLARGRRDRGTASDRGRGRRVAVTPMFRREDANLGFSAGPSTGPRPRSRIGKRELKFLEGNEIDQSERPKKRARRLPRRYGQDE